MSGVDRGFYTALIEARAIPGDIYRLDNDGYVWSALAAYSDLATAEISNNDTFAWVTPASANWLRCAKLSNTGNPDQISRSFQNQFASDFEQAVNTLNPSLRSYADKIGTASEAWSAWICGAYGVCLKAFSASIVVNKLTRRLRAWDLLDRGMNSRSQSDNETLLSDITQLSIILLPFSPFERETGTPGTVIDRGLKELQLGFENPFCNEK